MRVVQSIRKGDHPLVESIIAGLVTTDQQNRTAPGIESKEGPQRPPLVLSTGLLRIQMLGAGYAVRVRPWQGGAELPKELDAGCQRLLFLF